MVLSHEEPDCGKPARAGLWGQGGNALAYPAEDELPQRAIEHNGPNLAHRRRGRDSRGKRPENGIGFTPPRFGPVGSTDSTSLFPARVTSQRLREFARERSVGRGGFVR